MKKITTYKLAISASMAALAVLFDYLSVIRSDIFKVSIYGLPLMLAGTMFGPLVGLLSGAVAGFLIQFISPYGLTPATFIWMLAPMAWGFVSGLMGSGMKLIPNPKIKKVAIVVIVTSLSSTILNTFAMWLDGIIIGYPTPYIITALGSRLLISLGLAIAYCLLLTLILPRVQTYSSYYKK